MFNYHASTSRTELGYAVNKKKSEIYARHLERVFLSNTISFELDLVQCHQLNETRKKIKYSISLEVAKEIDNNFNPKKGSGYVEIRPKMIKELPKKTFQNNGNGKSDHVAKIG